MRVQASFTDDTGQSVGANSAASAKVVDVALDAVTVEATGNREKLDALIRVLEPFGIKELVQSGMVAVGRGGRSITDRALRPVERSA